MAFNRSLARCKLELCSLGTFLLCFPCYWKNRSFKNSWKSSRIFQPRIFSHCCILRMDSFPFLRFQIHSRCYQRSFRLKRKRLYWLWNKNTFNRQHYFHHCCHLQCYTNCKKIFNRLSEQWKGFIPLCFIQDLKRYFTFRYSFPFNSRSCRWQLQSVLIFPILIFWGF